MKKNIKTLAINNYKKFCELEGSDFIASEFALETLLTIIRNFKINSILEIGMGIGSVSDTVLKFVHNEKISLTYCGTENNDFCLKMLPQNVDFFDEILIFSNIDCLPKKKYDLIIIDGSDDSLSKLRGFCNAHAMIYIEGGRHEQTTKILGMFPNSVHVNVITLKKNPSYAHEDRSVKSYIGGGQLIFINPTFKMKIFWLKEKVSTFVKIKIRKITGKVF